MYKKVALYDEKNPNCVHIKALNLSSNSIVSLKFMPVEDFKRERFTLRPLKKAPSITSGSRLFAGSENYNQCKEESPRTSLIPSGGSPNFTKIDEQISNLCQYLASLQCSDDEHLDACHYVSIICKLQNIRESFRNLKIIPPSSDGMSKSEEVETIHYYDQPPAERPGINFKKRKERAKQLKEQQAMNEPRNSSSSEVVCSCCRCAEKRAYNDRAAEMSKKKPDNAVFIPYVVVPNEKDTKCQSPSKSVLLELEKNLYEIKISPKVGGYNRSINPPANSKACNPQNMPKPSIKKTTQPCPLPEEQYDQEICKQPQQTKERSEVPQCNKNDYNYETRRSSKSIPQQERQPKQQPRKKSWCTPNVRDSLKEEVTTSQTELEVVNNVVNYDNPENDSKLLKEEPPLALPEPSLNEVNKITDTEPAGGRNSIKRATQTEITIEQNTCNDQNVDQKTTTRNPEIEEVKAETTAEKQCSDIPPPPKVDPDFTLKAITNLCQPPNIDKNKELPKENVEKIEKTEKVETVVKEIKNCTTPKDLGLKNVRNESGNNAPKKSPTVKCEKELPEIKICKATKPKITLKQKRKNGKEECKKDMQIIDKNLADEIKKIANNHQSTVFIKVVAMEDSLYYIQLSTVKNHYLGCLFATETAFLEAKNSNGFEGYITLCITRSSSFLREVKLMVDFPFEMVDR